MPSSASSAATTPDARLGWRREILLAILPTVTVLLLLWLLKMLSNQQPLFAWLASSCFLIYLDPGHPANSARTLVARLPTGAAPPCGDSTHLYF